MMQETIAARLRAALAPSAIEVINESAAHAGHVGYSDGETHFRVRLVAAQFFGLSRVARHRLVYDSLADLMPQPIHALAIVALSPDEASPAPLAAPAPMP